jgi:hypothetical protein
VPKRAASLRDTGGNAARFSRWAHSQTGPVAQWLEQPTHKSVQHGGNHVSPMSPLLRRRFTLSLGVAALEQSSAPPEEVPLSRRKCLEELRYAHSQRGP